MIDPLRECLAHRPNLECGIRASKFVFVLASHSGQLYERASEISGKVRWQKHRHPSARAKRQRTHDDRLSVLPSNLVESEIKLLRRGRDDRKSLHEKVL